MANEPVPAQHDVVIQDPVTGAVDFLQFQGTTLTHSSLQDYHIGNFRVVANGDFNADGHPDLVVQSPTTGQLDFLYLDAGGHLLSTGLTTQGFAPVHGAGHFGTQPATQPGPELVSQLASGQIDLLGFNATGVLVASNLVANTTGLPHVIGASESDAFFPIFANNGAGNNDSIVVQYPDGTIDALGFTGDFTTTLTFTNSFNLPHSAGSPQLFALNQDFDFGLRADANASSVVDTVIRETVEMVAATSAGQIDHLFFDSGYNDLANEGAEIGTLAENFSIPTGWQIVDAGMVDHVDFFHIT
jgi:hypothetical protein